MLNEGEQKLHLLELYNKYNRQDTLLIHTYGAAILVSAGITGLLLATTPLSGGVYVDEGVFRANKEIIERRVINATAGAFALGAELGILRLTDKVFGARKHKIALEIAEAEERVPDETNDQRVVHTSALSSTLVYGIKFHPKFSDRLFKAYIIPILEGNFRNIKPMTRVEETFCNFDDGVDELPFGDEIKHEVELAALDLGKQRWEAIKKGERSQRLRGYSYVMLSEINRRLNNENPL